MECYPAIISSSRGELPLRNVLVTSPLPGFDSPGSGGDDG